MALITHQRPMVDIFILMLDSLIYEQMAYKLSGLEGELANVIPSVKTLRKRTSIYEQMYQKFPIESLQVSTVDNCYFPRSWFHPF